MADTPSQSFVNHLGMPIEYLWDSKLPLTVKLSVLIAHFHPKPVDTGTLVNITQEPRRKVKDALKALSARGAIERGAGRAILVADGLPETNEAGLRSLRGFYGKVRKGELPVPLKTRLAKGAEAARDALIYRLPREHVRWMLKLNAFKDPSWWARGLPKIVGECPSKLRPLAQYLGEAADEAGVDIEGLGQLEAVVTFAVQFIRLIDKERDRRVENPCGLLTTIIRQLDAAEFREDDVVYDATEPWLESLRAEPLADRPSLGEYLRRVERNRARKPQEATSGCSEAAQEAKAGAREPAQVGTPWAAVVGDASAGVGPTPEQVRSGVGKPPVPDAVDDLRAETTDLDALCAELLERDVEPRGAARARQQAGGLLAEVEHLLAGGRNHH